MFSIICPQIPAWTLFALGKLVIFSPLAEEYLMREVLQRRGLATRLGQSPLLLNGLLAIAFGVAHLPWQSAWRCALMAVLATGIGFLYQKTRSWRACALLHAAANLAYIGTVLLVCPISFVIS